VVKLWNQLFKKKGLPKSYRSILVPVTGQLADEEAIKTACGMMESSKGVLHVLYVIEIDRIYPIDAEIKAATAKGEDVLRHMENIARVYNRRTEAELIQARQAGSAIVHESMEKDAEVVVMGIQKGQRFGEFSLGNTVPYVIKNAQCSVILRRSAKD
jgi:nucleotide-binding universal stress UspA family protein